MSKQLDQRAALNIAELRPAEGDRRATILAAALDVFMRYGFSRATMDDISREAGISRPALYREFRNKADIYAAIAAVLLDRAARAAEDALGGPEPLEGRLAAALRHGVLDLMTAISQSPHGGEILDMKDRLTADIIKDWRTRLAAALTDAIAAETDRRGTDLSSRGFSPEALAETLLDGLEGVKQRADDPAEWRKAADRLVSLVMLALR